MMVMLSTLLMLVVIATLMVSVMMDDALCRLCAGLRWMTMYD